MKSLVERFSTDKRKTENEGIYDVTRSGFDKTFTEAAYALKTGAYTTKPVKTPFGYHVIQALAAPTEAGFKPLAEVAEQIRAALADKRSDSAAAAWFDGVQAEYETKTTFADGYGLPAAT
jgi:foldase protein PrsA